MDVYINKDFLGKLLSLINTQYIILTTENKKGGDQCQKKEFDVWGLISYT